MRRIAFVLLVSPLIVASLVTRCDAGFHVTDKGVLVWEAPSGGFQVGGIGEYRTGELAEMVRLVPEDAKVLKAFTRIVTEDGVWLNFSVHFMRVKKVVFTKGTKIVLIDKSGKRIESEVICFWPDYMQTEVYDASVRPVVVTRRSCWGYKDAGRPFFSAKFSAGSVVRKNIVEFEVVGAVEDSTYQEAQ
jgi:hypothetical protein